MATKSFKDAYGVLQQHAETLREQQEPNIDDLLTIVTESVDAYKVCQQRIEAVEKALEKALSDTGIKGAATISTCRRRSWRSPVTMCSCGRQSAWRSSRTGSRYAGIHTAPAHRCAIRDC